MNLQRLIEKHWYTRTNLLLSIILIVPSLIFLLISKIRYHLYKHKILKSYKLPVPVVIIGNISVGGVGKTPLTKMLGLELQSNGFKVGIILRGYKSNNKSPRLVNATDNSDDVGDEALIYATNGLKVAIGSNRYAAGLILLEKYPDLDLILADDGMQHYRLNRDFEIAVVDRTRLFGNKFILPMGPLREPVSRLKLVDAIVINGKSINNSLKSYSNKSYTQTIVLDKIYNPISKLAVNPDFFKNKRVIAMAAIGNPTRFFNLLQELDIMVDKELSFPDHYHYTPNDIPDDAIILVTEKDYTKLSKFNNPNIYVIFVKAKLSSTRLLRQITELV